MVDTLYEEDSKKRGDKQRMFFDLCGHAATVSVMMKHADCSVLQELGIVVLTNATRDNQAIKAAVEKVDGIQGEIWSFDVPKRKSCKASVARPLLIHIIYQLPHFST